MAIVTGDRYVENLTHFIQTNSIPLLEPTTTTSTSTILKLNPVGLHYVQSRLEALSELENLLAGAPIDYLRAYISDLGDHRALEQLRRFLRLLPSLKILSVLPAARDPTRISLSPFENLKVLELRGCDLSTSEARGLLELRHTLEKLICHDSTDALRHVFASRTAEIKDSPHWTRLQFVSCACNRLVLMDESLHLLSAVETLDLSRNKFTKVDNLRNCSKLKHLDLGFNHLRTIGSLREVSSHTVRLVLRNNALRTLHGIENLKSLKDIDLSYNIISEFSEIEILAGLPSLQSLWLEGNPLCCAQWYRSQVFSLFPHPETLELDEKEIGKREFLKMQIIIASRQTRPTSFGFYFPAKEGANKVNGRNTKRQKNFSRLACIEGEGQSLSSDQESVSCDNEIHDREVDAMSDDGAEIVDLMNKVDQMKKDRSILWLREFKEWMDTNTTSANMGEGSSCSGAILDRGSNIFSENKAHMSDSMQGEAASKFSRGDSACFKHGASRPKDLNAYTTEYMSLIAKRSYHWENTDVSGTSITSLDDLMESLSSYAFTGSPPQYQEDILHRRHNLVEESLQLSANSFSEVSSDSNSSCSEDDICNISPSGSDFVPLLDEIFEDMLVDENSLKTLVEDKYCEPSEVSRLRENNSTLFDSLADEASCSSTLGQIQITASAQGTEISDSVQQQGDSLGKKSIKKQKRRIVSLLDDTNIFDKADISVELNRIEDICKDDLEEQLGKSTSEESAILEDIYEK